MQRENGKAAGGSCCSVAFPHGGEAHLMTSFTLTMTAQRNLDSDWVAKDLPISTDHMPCLHSSVGEAAPLPSSLGVNAVFELSGTQTVFGSLLQ